MRKLSISLCLLISVLTALLSASQAHAQVRVDNPSCYSTTEDYITEEISVPIQPQTPVTLKRFQGPLLKLFCISFEESGPTCTGTTTNGVAQLCYRPVGSTAVDYTCEDLTDFQSEVNSRIERGNINGQEMIWLLRWDGTAQPLSCFPKVVTARMLIFVQPTDVESIAVLVIMSIIVAIVVILMIVAFYSFLVNRYMVIDEAGATTIGGPGAQYRGPQMQIGQNSQVLSHTRVLLPVRGDDAGLNDMRSSKFGQLTQVNENVSTEEILMPRGQRTRASPPRPGDGVRDGMFPSPSRQQRGGQFGDGYGDDGEFYDDDEGYTSGGSGFGRGRRGRGGRGGRGEGGSGRGRDSYFGRGRKGGRKGGKGGDDPDGALFPTQTDFETTGGAGMADGYDYDPETGMPIRRDGLAPGLPLGMDSRVKQVKAIPRWMQGSFGRGGMVPEPLDGDFPEDGNDAFNGAAKREIDMKSPVQAFGVYGKSPKRQRTPERRDPYQSGDENYGPNGPAGSANKFGSGLKYRGNRALGDRTPNQNNTSAFGGSGRKGYDSEDGGARDQFRGGNRRRNARRNLSGRLAQGYDDGENDPYAAEVDNFQRNKARLSSGNEIDPTASEARRAGSRGRNSGGGMNNSNGSRTGGNFSGGLDSDAPMPSRMNTASMERPGASGFKCNKCNFQFTGTSGDPVFCAVDGERHF